MDNFDLSKHLENTGFKKRAIVYTDEYWPGFRLKVKFVDKQIVTDMLNKAMDITFKEGKRRVDFNNDRYSELMVEHIVDWEGLKGDYVAEMCLAEREGIPDLIPFTKETALALLTHDQTGLADFIATHMRDTSRAFDEETEQEKKT